MACWRCRSPTAAGEKFCSQCGASIAGGDGEQKSSGSYTPPYLMQKVLTAQGALEGERKQVTVLFCDIVESTSLASRIGPDAMHELLGWFFDVALGEVHRYGGTVNQFLGDGLMALFGAPVAHEDHARRAVLASLAILRRLKHERPMLAGQAAPLLDARAGLNSGLVVIGSIGSDLRTDYTAMGEPTHVAARLQSLASAGTICISEPTLRLLREEFVCRPLGLRTLKGIAKPVTVYQVLAPRPSSPGSASAERQTASAGGKPPQPFVGRRAELDTLAAWINRGRAGQGGVVCVIGEPGIGKSRLLAEARTTLGEGLLWLRAHGVSLGTHISYLPFLQALRAALGITEHHRGPEAWSLLQSSLAGLFVSDLDQWSPYLGSFIGAEVPHKLAATLALVDNEAMGRQIFAAYRHFFERLSRTQPVVLDLDDYQWFDGSSSMLLEHLLPLVHVVPLVILVSSRTESATLARLREVLLRQHRGAYVELRLGPLSPGESMRMLRNLVPAGQDVRRPMLERAGGNPFFLEEIVRSPDAPARPDETAIPEAVQDLIAARIDRLDEDIKHILKLAAVVGRSFLYKVLAAIGEEGASLDRRLGELEELHFVHERQRMPEREYMFRHALVHEVTYDSILVRRRKALHLRVARCMEELFSDRLEEFYGFLAHHYMRAEEWESAHRYLVLAGDQSGRMAADAEALANYEQAIAAYERAFGDRWEPLQHARLVRKIAECLFRRGEFDQAVRYLQRALNVLGTPALPTSRWGIRLATLREGLRQAWRLTQSEGARENPADARADIRERYRIYEVMGWIDFFISQDRMFLDTLHALHTVEREGLSAETAQAQAGVAIALDMISLPRLAGRYIERATENAQRSAHPRALGYALFARGIHAHFIEGRLDDAADAFKQSVDAYRRIGDVRAAGAAASCWAHGFLVRGQFPQCRSLSGAEAKIATDSGDQQVYGWFKGHLAYLAFLQGEPLDDVIRQADDAIALFEAIPDYGALAQTKALVSRCYLARGDLPRALRVAVLTLRIIKGHETRGPLIPYLLGWLADSASAALLAARRGTLKPDDERAAAEIGRAVLKWGSRTREGEVCALRWRGSLAWSRGRHRRARKCWSQALIASEALRSDHEVARTCLAIGRFSEERDALIRAQALLDALGAAAELAEARSLLQENIR